jgi:glycosyltransferase involved in cell wall biosynthesis
MPRPLRILVVAFSLDMPGGMSVQAARLVARLREANWAEAYFLPANPRLSGVLRSLQALKYVRTVVTSLAYLYSLLKNVGRCDVVHVFTASYSSFLLVTWPALFVGKLYRKKIIINYRSGRAADHLRRWPLTAVPTLRRADALVVPSGYLVDVFGRFGLKAFCVHNIIDTDRCRFRTRRPLRPVFLSVRNLEPRYNIECTLRAFACVQRLVPQSRLTVAGTGGGRARLEALARELGLCNVEFIGFIKPERMHLLYERADILLNSPDVDNMPSSVLEAFASGVPVVSTEAGGIPYILTGGETGVLVRRGDHQAMARGALCLLNDEEFASRIVSKARMECRKYTWAAVGSQWRELYTEVAVRG